MSFLSVHTLEDLLRSPSTHHRSFGYLVPSSQYNRQDKKLSTCAAIKVTDAIALLRNSILCRLWQFYIIKWHNGGTMVAQWRPMEANGGTMQWHNWWHYGGIMQWHNGWHYGGTSQWHNGVPVSSLTGYSVPCSSQIFPRPCRQIPCNTGTTKHSGDIPNPGLGILRLHQRIYKCGDLRLFRNVFYGNWRFPALS